MQPSTRLGLIALLAALPSASIAQQGQPRALPNPDASFEEPFTLVSGLRELSNGRLLVADARDKILSLVDLTAGSAAKIGREGSGPGEYNLPFRLYAAAADTTFLFDPGNSRYLVIHPDGKPGANFRVEAPVSGNTGGGVRLGGFSMARQVDARGRLYFEQPGFSQGPNGVPQQADSAPIVRYDRATQKFDTMAFVRLQKSNVQVSGGANNQRVMIGGANPLAPRDEWAVFPDGRVAVVRYEPYRVEMISPTKQRTTGAALRYTPIRMTDADRKEEEEVRRRQSAGGLRMMVIDGPEGRRMSASVGGGGPLPDLPPLTDWPATKPPFRAGLASVWARPNGDLWVRRLEPAGAKGALYDVINARGDVAFQVRFPVGVNLVGFGNGTIYTTKADEDDLLYLQRHSDRERRLIGQAR